MNKIGLLILGCAGLILVSACSDSSKEQTVANNQTQACKSADLSIHYVDGEGATGHQQQFYAINNQGARDCIIADSIGVRSVDTQGHEAPPASGTTFGNAGQKGLDYPVMLHKGQRLFLEVDNLSSPKGIVENCHTAHLSGFNFYLPENNSPIHVKTDHAGMGCMTTGKDVGVGKPFSTNPMHG